MDYVGGDANPSVGHSKHCRAVLGADAYRDPAPAGVYFSALLIKFVMICSMRDGSASTQTGTSSTETSWPAVRPARRMTSSTGWRGAARSRATRATDVVFPDVSRLTSSRSSI